MKTLLGALALMTLVQLTGCEKQGPLERAGERVDDAMEDAADSLETHQGPAEAAGEKIDEAFE